MPFLFRNVRAVLSMDVSSSRRPISHVLHSGCVLVGLALRVGAWLDRVSPIFAELLDDGSFGTEIEGPALGGMGGISLDLRIAPGRLITAVQTRSGNFIEAVRLLHAPWNGDALDLGAQRWTPWAGSSRICGVKRTMRISEPQDAAVGIAGRAACFVNDLTLIGAELVRVTAIARAAG